jgi:AAA+ superfamily predicted ATPase
VEASIKDRLLSQSLLNYTVRGQVDRARVPLHGIILLAGPPGTGKTSLAKGLADRVSQFFPKSALTYLEVEPHSLQSSFLGKSQKAVTDLFATTIAEHATQGLTFVLLDEVETLVVDRSKLSMEANPIDVHRATDAALVQLDHLAETHPNLLFVATSNFATAIDSAFRSRCDLIVNVPLPGPEAIESIMRDTLQAFSDRYPKMAHILNSTAFPKAVHAARGLDGRQVRKAVASAFALDRKVALNPELLTGEQLLLAIQLAAKEGTTK